MRESESQSAIQDDVDTISLAIQWCDCQHRALAGQRALNRLVDENKRLRGLLRSFVVADLSGSAKKAAAAIDAIHREVDL